MTVMEYSPSGTMTSGEVGRLISERVQAVVRHQTNLFDTFSLPIWKEEDFVQTRRRRYKISEMLDGVTEEAMARLNRSTSWVQEDPSVGDEY